MLVVHSADPRLVLGSGPSCAREQADALEFLAWDRELADAPAWADPDAGAAPARSDTERAQAMLARPADLSDAQLIDFLDPGALRSPALALALAKRIDEVTAMLTARQVALTARVAGPTASDQYLTEVHLETEIALARAISPTLAGLEVETARALTTTFPGFHDALAHGQVSLAHCRRLVQATRAVTDPDALARIAAAALPCARGRTLAMFTRSLRHLIARHDPDATARRTQAITSERDVQVHRMDDGLGRLVYTDEWSKVTAVGQRIRLAGRATQVARQRAAEARIAAEHGATPGPGTAKSRRKSARKLAAAEARDRWDNAGQDHAVTAAACRADAILGIVLGREHHDGTLELDPDGVLRIECQVVIDLDTLRGEADHAALLDGHPVPADVGRHWARHARTYRRMVTDPVTGHLLDKGRTYMADDVRDFVLARDGGCRLPVCGIQHPDRLQADHATEHPAGATSAANLGALSTTHHQLKTHRYLRITDSASDGSATLHTAWGQRILIPPRPYLHEPDPLPRHHATPPDTHDEPPF